MEAIVLAGGFGTRLRPLVTNVPKPMAPIAGRPFLEFLLESLALKGFDHVVLSLGYMADKVFGYFGNRFEGLDITYVIENTPLGTGGAIRLALEACHSDHVFVFNGDTYLNLDVNALEQQWQTLHHSIVVGKKVLDTTRYGRLIVDKFRIINFAEKGVSGPGLINAGCYLLPSDALNNFPINQPFSLETDYFQRAVAYTEFDVFVTDGEFIDIGVPEDYLAAKKILGNL